MKKTLDRSILDMSLLALTIGVFSAFLLVNVLGIHMAGPYAWDDGAITLAYARTLAENGMFAVTSVSEVVEGSSSLLFVALMALLHAALDFDFYQFILASQIVALVATCGTMLLLYVGLEAGIPNGLHRALIAGLLGLLPMFTAEILNGMEMSLFALLMVAFGLTVQARSKWAYLLVPPVLLVRFEAIFYLGFALFFLLLSNRSEFRYLAKVAACVALTFAAITLCRWMYFDDVLPNTIWAKMNPPYSGADLPSALKLKKAGLDEFYNVNKYLLIFGFGLLICRRQWRERLDANVLLAISFGIFSYIAGRNWGYEGRMTLACVPLLTLMISDNLRAAMLRLPAAPPDAAHFSWSDKAVRHLKSGSMNFLVLAGCLAAMHVINAPLFEANQRTAGTGGNLQRRQPADHYGWYGTTPENYKITGMAVDLIRLELKLPVIKFMAPDVGGLALCCGKIQVLDSALLTNKFLARNGYRSFDAYLQRVVPDVIETHDIWSGESDIYSSAFFSQNYAPLVFANNLLWIRVDLLPALTASERMLMSVRSVESISQVRYGAWLIDQMYLRSRYPDGIRDMKVE